MKSVSWKDIAEIIGVAAIVASLIFVGMQMKQSHEIALAEMYQRRTELIVEESLAIASNPHILNAFIKAYSDRTEEIEPIERMAAQYLTGADMAMFENSHYMYTLGYISEEHWLRARSNLKALMESPFDRQLIESRVPKLKPSFRQVVEEIEGELASAPDR